MLKINQSVFIRDFLQSENMTKYNRVTILIKVGFFIKMQETDDYKEVMIKTYQ